MGRSLLALLLCVLVQPAYSIPIHSGFDDGLDGWSASGDAFAAGGAAALGDRTAAHSRLAQNVNCGPGLYLLSFEFSPLLSGFHPAGWFPDTFFASLSIAGTGAALLDVDAAGARFDQGVLTRAPRGGDWLRFSRVFNLPGSTIEPVFELYSYNGLSGDSFVLIDNVSLALIPEPPTWTLILLGLAACGLVRRRLRVLLPICLLSAAAGPAAAQALAYIALATETTLEIASGPSAPDRQTTFAAGSFLIPPTARLVILPLQAGPRLCWRVELHRSALERHAVLVDAATGDVLYRINMVRE